MTWVALITALFGAVTSIAALVVMWKTSAIKARIEKIESNVEKSNEAITKMATTDTPEEMHAAIKDFATSWKH